MEEKEFITYGIKKFIPSKFKKIRNRKYCNKPSGGLWASSIDSKIGWKDYCISSSYYKKDGLKNYIKFKIKPESNIYIIDSLNDLYSLPFQINDDMFGQTYIDFKKMAESGYQGVYLTEKGLTRTSSFLGYEFNLYGWDVESLVIFDPNIMISSSKLPRIKLKKNWKKTVVIVKTRKNTDPENPELLRWEQGYKEADYNSVIVERGCTYSSKKSFIRALRRLQHQIGDDSSARFIMK